MKPKIAKLWIDALRSGQYKQGRCQLRDGDKYCCLGVLCELYRIHTKSPAQWGQDDHSFLYAVYWLPIQVQQWAGLNSDNPILRVCGSASCAACNDHRCLPFSKIADAIERTFLPKKKKT